MHRRLGPGWVDLSHDLFKGEGVFVEGWRLMVITLNYKVNPLGHC